MLIRHVQKIFFLFNINSIILYQTKLKENYLVQNVDEVKQKTLYKILQVSSCPFNTPTFRLHVYYQQLVSFACRTYSRGLQSTFKE